MKNTLRHTDFRADGIFGEFTFDGDDKPFMVTLEHAYDQGDGTFAPKLQPGIYTCKRGHHELHCGPVETFEVLGVEGHAGILCSHVGNKNDDSEGCVLSGRDIAQDGDAQMITNSRATFLSYMARLAGVDEFQLEVI